KRRVVVTGMGMVTCLGSGVETNWEAITQGRSGIGRITHFDTSGFSTHIAGEVKDGFDIYGCIPAKEFRRLDRHQQYALVASHEAFMSSGLEIPPADPYRCAVVVGSGMGGLETIETGHDTLKTKGPKRMSPLVIPMVVVNLTPGLLSMKYQFKGPNFGVVNACASGASAIGEAFRLVSNGYADVAITGGTEAVVSAFSVSAFNAIRALSVRNDEPKRASRPFDKDRDGFVLAEGAGILILEDLETAAARGATIYSEIVGYGATGDAYHLVMPDPEGQGAYNAMKLALMEANVSPKDVSYINAHGTSTELNDKIESLAIKKLFGEHAGQVSISSTKSMTGHMIGAAGAVEAIFSIMAMRTNIVPPTINLDNPDPDCDLNYTPHKSVEKPIDCAISNSFAFGGQNAALVFKKV
ncbi:MAG: beta-ketoacyl-ACP synthase II, partial [Syntrophaceae bacterium]|nr:beta-ketoacyl-ACP synthase II [Syntrophaceae bacterium]